MRFALALAAGIVAAILLGTWTAWLTVRDQAPIDAITIGSWQAWPNAGTSSVDPYSHARLSKTGEIPLGSGEGLALFADTDALRRPLNERCDYRIVGQTPPARLWTMVIEHADGSVADEGTGTHAIGSDGILRAPDGSFDVAVSGRPQPGNWLSSSEAGRFRIVVRLYDTTVRTVTALTDLTMPRIERQRCT